jgi:predicted DNA-binding antitoxin AbrB/MazE fold protein
VFTVEAVYQGGVFKPLGEVKLEENQRVTLHVNPVPTAAEALAWLEKARRFREQLAAKYGTFPNCTPEIAEDRRREI